MVPQTAFAVLAFLIFVLPGIAFEILRQHRRPALSQSGFQEATTVAVASAVFSGVSLAILALIRSVRPDWMPDLGAWMTNPPTYVRENYRLIARAGLVEVFVALLLVAVVHRSLNEKAGSGLATWVQERASAWLRHDPARAIWPHSVWWVILRGVAPHGSVTAVSVRTKDGRVFTGKVAAYGAGEADERDVALEAPVEVVDSKTGAREVIGHPWKHVILPAGDIAEVAVTYPPRGWSQSAT